MKRPRHIQSLGTGWAFFLLPLVSQGEPKPVLFLFLLMAAPAATALGICAAAWILRWFYPKTGSEKRRIS
jgi:hypothetical protein